MTSGTRSGDRRLAQVADAQVERRRPPSAARRAQTSSIPREESTPITRIPSAAIGTAIRPVPTPSSTTGPAGPCAPPRGRRRRPPRRCGSTGRRARRSRRTGSTRPLWFQHGHDACSVRVYPAPARRRGRALTHAAADPPRAGAVRIVRRWTARGGNGWRNDGYSRRRGRRGARTRGASAIAGAATPDELDDARVRYLGRKSELKQALREVRDRETGHGAERASRAARGGGRRARGGARARRARPAASDEIVDVTLPGDGAPPRPPAPAHPDPARGRGHLPRARLRGRRRPRGRDAWHNFDALNMPLRHPARSPRDTFYVDDDTLLRTRDVAVADPRDGGARAADLHRRRSGRVYRRDTPDATH